MSMKSKIAALLRKAESSQFKEEAETFLAKAHDLMEKHQISFAQGDDNGGTPEADPIGTGMSKSFEIGTQAAERYILEARVAAFFGCKVIRCVLGNRAYYEINGTESARVTHEAMFPYIWKQVGALAAKNAPSAAVQKRLKRDIARALASRLYRIKADREASRAQEVQAGSSTALVLAGVDQAVEAYVSQRYSNMKKGKARKTKAPSNLSRILAEQVSVERQVAGSKTPQTISGS